MAKHSRRAERMERHHKRKKQYSGLNIVSLMDIFTILVFFLLVSSSDVEVLPNAKTLELPESTSKQKPEETLVVMVNDEDIVVEGLKIAAVQEVIDSPEAVIEALASELQHQATRMAKSGGATEDFRGEITIMADKAIPYKLLKKIMLTCARTRYSDISLAVMQRPDKGGGSV